VVTEIVRGETLIRFYNRGSGSGLRICVALRALQEDKRLRGYLSDSGAGICSLAQPAGARTNTNAIGCWNRAEDLGVLGSAMAGHRLREPAHSCP
jgi:hypothetical protein